MKHFANHYANWFTKFKLLKLFFTWAINIFWEQKKTVETFPEWISALFVLLTVFFLQNIKNSIKESPFNGFNGLAVETNGVKYEF